MCCVEMAPNVYETQVFPVLKPDGYAMLMSPNKSETAFHDRHCSGDKAMRMQWY